MRYTKILPLLLWFLLPGMAFAGRSLVLTPGVQISSVNDPTFARNQSWRVEFQVHNWTLPAANVRLFDLTGVGAAGFLYPDGRIALEDDRDAVSPQQPCFVNTAGLHNVLVRLQRDLATMQVVCEIWNYDGTGYDSQTEKINSTNAWTSSGGSIGGGLTASLGFLRVFTTTVPPGSKPPTTAEGGNWTELKFDNNLSDSSGRGHSASLSGASYANTPNQTVAAFPKTRGAPSWSNWTSLRAGFPSQLDGTASYSLADTSSSVNYLWQQVSGPTIVIWSDKTAATPTITGLIFGHYVFSLRTTDIAGNSTQATLQVGAVAYDSNGVVQSSDPHVAEIFGLQIAFGQNPWAYEDERNLHAINGQIAYQSATYDSSWSTPGQGTVSYSFAGKSAPPGATCTTLNGAILATDMTITVADANCLSLAGLPGEPTWVMIGDQLGATVAHPAQEVVRICSRSGNVLTVCYDGRGLAGNANFWTGTLGATAWPSGTKVGEMRVQGTGTLFSTDSNRPVCPAGVPGPPGAVVYSTGTATLSAGSRTVTGSGTTWTSAMVGGFIRVTATHASGSPFVFWGQISTWTDATHLVLNRPAPAGVDGNAFNYKITSPAMYLSLEFVAPDGHVARVLQNGLGCESETAMFADAEHDIGGISAITQTGVKYSYKTALSLYSTSGTFTSNFYGVGIAARNFYYRSGYGPALTLANSIDEFAVRDPEIGDGLVGGTPLALGGTVIGGMIDLVLNRSTVLTWPNVEAFARTGELGSRACNYSDTRDGGYMTSWLTLAANYDLDSTKRTAFKTALRAVLTRDQTCKRNASDGYSGAEVNSFSNSFAWIPSVPLTLTNGSASVTGTGFTPGMCSGTATGTIAVTRGSAAAQLVSGTLAAGVRIIISDTRTIPLYSGGFEFSFTGSSVSLAGIWPGASGTFPFMVEDNSLSGSVSGIWTDNTDDLATNRALEKNWTCKYNSPTSLTLNREWDAPSGSNYHISSYTVGTFGQQPFMFGVKMNQVKWASQNDDPIIAAGYAAIKPLMGEWFNSYGYNSLNTKGTFYNSVFKLCEPVSVLAAGSFFSIHGQPSGCGVGGILGASTERVNSAEGGAAMMQFYLADPTPARKAVVDQFYGAIFGYTPWCAPSVVSTCDGIFATNQENSDLEHYKWPGFFFGMGGFFTNSWPAVRNGIQPARIRGVSIAFSMGTAASVRVKVTQPSGTESTFPCSATPCVVTVDDQHGSYWYEIQYLSGTGQVLSTSQPVLLPLAPQP